MKRPLDPPNVDYLVIESTYGDRLHPSSPPMELLKDIIINTSQRGGTILIPSFAVGRAQSILYYLYLLKKNQLIPDIPIFLDSPMAIDATNIFSKYVNEHRLTAAETKAVCHLAHLTRTPEESKAINENTLPKIIISASGMATGGRILHHLKFYAPSHRNTILFAGYQAGGTRGDRILQGAKTIRIHGMDILIGAQVEYLSNMSAHSDYQEILTWLEKLHQPPRQVFITHGEKAAAQSLKEKIEKKFGFNCSIPHYEETVSL